MAMRITRFCDERYLSLRERLDLFIQLCQAIQHAHQKGIIHRDIKPSNILVTMNDGVPAPKVIDFGIAKATQVNLADKTIFTVFEQFLGTPAYMSPEQAEVRGVDVDTRSDIYSLGVVLYELLTGQTPFDSKALLARGIEELILALRHEEPPHPSRKLSSMAFLDLQVVARSRRCEAFKLVHSLQGDLDWILMKCLEKDRARRYHTANGLAADLQRHLVHEPVVARPPSTAYKLQKAWQRNRLVLTAGAVGALALFLGAGVGLWQAVRATHARQLETRHRLAAEQAEAEAHAKSREAERERHRAEASEARTADLLYAANLGLVQAAIKENNLEYARRLLADTANNPKRGFEWYYWQHYLHREAGNGTARTWEPNALDGPLVWRDPDLTEPQDAAVSPNGRWIASAHDGRAVIWDAASGEIVHRLTVDAGNPDRRGEWAENGVNAVSFSPDSQRLVVAANNSVALVFKLETGAREMVLDHSSVSPNERSSAVRSIPRMAGRSLRFHATSHGPASWRDR